MQDPMFKVAHDDSTVLSVYNPTFKLHLPINRSVIQYGITIKKAIANEANKILSSVRTSNQYEEYEKERQRQAEDIEAAEREAGLVVVREGTTEAMAMAAEARAAAENILDKVVNPYFKLHHIEIYETTNIDSFIKSIPNNKKVIIDNLQFSFNFFYDNHYLQESYHHGNLLLKHKKQIPNLSFIVYELDGHKTFHRELPMEGAMYARAPLRYAPTQQWQTIDPGDHGVSSHSIQSAYVDNKMMDINSIPNKQAKMAIKSVQVLIEKMEVFENRDPWLKIGIIVGSEGVKRDITYKVIPINSDGSYYMTATTVNVYQDDIRHVLYVNETSLMSGRLAYKLRKRVTRNLPGLSGSLSRTRRIQPQDYRFKTRRYKFFQGSNIAKPILSRYLPDEIDLTSASIRSRRVSGSAGGTKRKNRNKKSKRNKRANISTRHNKKNQRKNTQKQQKQQNKKYKKYRGKK